MPFQFPLESVLRLRRGQERMDRLKLEAIAAELAQARRRLDFLANQNLELRRAHREALGRETYAAELHFEEEREERFEAAHRAMEIRIAQLEQERLKQAEKYKRSRQNREILENLREKKLEIYLRALSRREQQALDDLFLMRQGTRSEE